MGTIGGYETVRELHRFREVVVYAARPAGGSGAAPQNALKVFRPQVDPATDAGLEADAKATAATTAARRDEQGLLFALQEDLAKKCRHWAPIHEQGATGDGGVYAALDLYPRSVQWLQKLRVKLDPASLYHVIHSIVKGLQELRAQASRPHGNLKPSNIFLAGRGRKVSRARILLSEPAPPDAAREADDVRALGEILYQCVTYERFSTADLQVNDSPDWQRLGKTSEGWRKLCADLVDPFTRTPPALDDVAKRVQALKVGRKAWVRPVAWAAVLMVVGLVGLYAMWQSRNHKEWLRYDAAYHGWFGDMQRAMCVQLDPSTEFISKDEEWRYYFDPKNPKPKYRPAYYRGDDTFNALLSEWTAASKVTDPKDINDFSLSSPDAIRRNLERVEALRKRLEEWPALAQAKEAAELLQECGQTALAARFKTPADKIKAALAESGGSGAAYVPGQLPEAIDELAKARKEAGPALAKALEAAREIRRLQGVLAGSGDPLLVEFQKRVGIATQPEAATGAPKDLNDRLGDLADQLNKCARAGRTIEPMVKEGKWQPPKTGWPAPAPQQPGNATDLVAQLQARSEQVAAAAKAAAVAQAPVEKLPDWQPLAARLDPLDRLLNDVRGRLDTLAKDPDAKVSLVGEQRNKLDELAAELAAVRAAVDKLKTPPATVTPEVAATYRSQAAEADTRIKALEAKVRPLPTAVAELANQAKQASIARTAMTEEQKKAEQRKAILASQASRFDDDEELAAVWTRCLPGLTQAADAEKDPVKLGAFFDAAAKNLQEYVQKYAPLDPPAAPAPSMDADARDYEKPLLARVAADWPAERATILKAIDAAALLESTGARIASAYETRKAAYGQKLSRAQLTAAAAGELRRRMLWCEIPGREAPGSRTLRGLTDAVRSSEFAAATKPEPMLTALLPLADAVLAAGDRLATLAAKPPTFAAADREQLVAWCKAPASPAQRRTAWLGLQQMSEVSPTGIKPWPVTDDEKNVEVETRENLRREYEQRAKEVRESGDPASPAIAAAEQWLTQLRQELEDKGPPALQRYIEAPFIASGDPRNSLDAFSAARSPVTREGFSVKDEAAFILSLHPRIQLAHVLNEIPESELELTTKDNVLSPKVVKLAESLSRLATSLDAKAKSPGETPERQKDCKAIADKARTFSAELTRMTGGAPPVPAVPLAIPMADPAKSGLATINWKFEALPGDILQYTNTDPARPGMLQFAKVAQGKYVATTELSVEQANALVFSAQKAGKGPAPLWTSILKLSAANEGLASFPDDVRLGARSWVWDPTGTQLLPTRGWLSGANTWKHYPDAVGRIRLPNNARGGNPHPTHPLQRISPSAAVYLAALAGARLPTVAEWKLAYVQESQAPGFSAAQWIRRDVRFEAQVRHMDGEKRKDVGGIQYPDASMFLPVGVAAADQSAVPGVPDDGVLWFCGVNSGGDVNASGIPVSSNPAPGQRFKHIVGNVAEYVTEEPFVAAAIRADTATDWVKVKKAGKSRIFVIGASGLSPARYGDVEAKPDAAFEADGSSLAGYSDVGIRLALDLAARPAENMPAAPPQPLVARLNEFLDAAKP